MNFLELGKVLCNQWVNLKKINKNILHNKNKVVQVTIHRNSLDLKYAHTLTCGKYEFQELGVEIFSII